MSDIVVRRRHHLPRQEARAAAEGIAARLKQEFGLHFQWEGDTLSFKRSGVSGQFALAEHTVEIHVRLGFLLMPLRGRVEQEIQRELTAHFGPPAGPVV